jgi:hypothetical protein
MQLVTPGNYTDIDDLISAIYEGFAHIKRWDDVSAGENTRFSLRDVVSIYVNKATQRLTFQFKENRFKCYHLRLTFPHPALRELFGLGDTSVVRLGSPNLHLRAEDRPHNPPSFTVDRPVNLHRGVYNLYIYSDIVGNSVVGNRNVPLLHLVPVQGKQGEYVSLAVENKIYRPVVGREIRTVWIKVADFEGDRVKFNHGSGEFVAVLHFRNLRK